MKAVIIGYGSIGSRHARILDELGCEVAVISRRDVSVSRRFTTIACALDDFDPELVVIANETALHEDAIVTLAAEGFGGHLVVEKPLTHRPSSLPESSFSSAGVAYNLRFHPVIERLKEEVGNRSALSVWAYVGQYLPSWRSTSDYSQSYSVTKARGGGVLRDISHEIDFLQYVFGPWQQLAALGGHVSHLAGDSEDMICLLARQDGSAATGFQLNYLDRVGQRHVICNMDDRTLVADLVAGTFMDGARKEVFAIDRDHTYRRMWAAVLEGGSSTMCTFAEAEVTVRFIAAAEEAIGANRWVDL